MKIRVIGPAHLNTGLGVHTRLVADALRTQRYHDITVMPFHETRYRTQYSAGNSAYDDGKYDVNIFCVNYPSIARIADTMPYILRGARKNVCFGAWELEKAPESFAKLPKYVDAYFAQSRFVESAFRGNVDVPIYYTPLPLSKAVIQARHMRSHYRKMTNDFRCGFVFSVDSTMTRKNPQAIINAFSRAFADVDSARLILKISVSREGDKNHQSFLRFYDEIRKNPKIDIVQNNMSEIEYIQFLKTFSVYTSLHRSEGFGLTLLEAIGADVPCVTTAYSGNVDFCVPGNSVLVPYELIDLSPEDYHGQTQRWADASVEAAAKGLKAMQQGELIYPNHLLETVEDFFPQRVGRLYSECLEQVYSS